MTSSPQFRTRTALNDPALLRRSISDIEGGLHKYHDTVSKTGGWAEGGVVAGREWGRVGGGGAQSRAGGPRGGAQSRAESQAETGAGRDESS